jgi:hypothetical protein
MTLGEVERYLLSFQRREERRLKEKAIFDYKLGLHNLIFKLYYF